MATGAGLKDGEEHIFNNDGQEKSPRGSIHESLNDSVDNNFINMMRNIDQDDASVNFERDPDILEALEDIEEVEDFGPSILTHVADAFSKTAKRPLSKETAESLKKGLKVPENCKIFRTPKVNPEIWQPLRTPQRVTDLKLQHIQNGYSVALTTLAIMSNEIANAAKVMPKELVTRLLKLGMDGANLVGNQMQEISQRRRLEIKPYLNPEYAGICNDKVPSGEFLFGDNLAESLKTTRATSAVLRRVGLPANRTRPYTIPNRYPSLNYQRPFPAFRGRWNGQHQQEQRGRNPNHRFQQYNSQRQAYPQQSNWRNQRQ